MRSRPALRSWHKWFGILGGGWLMLLAATGSAIAWYGELDIALNPELRLAPEAQGPAASMDAVVARAEAELPGFAPSMIILAPEPGRSHWLMGRQVLPAGEVRSVQVFADPGTGAVLGWRDSEAHALGRKHIPDLLYGLHVDLLAGPVGAWIVGIVGLAWLIDHVLAIPLAVPRRRTWSAAFRLSGEKGSLRRLFDWHRAKGVWLWPLTATLALTGVTLTFHDASRAVAGAISPVGGRLHETMAEMAPPSDPIALETAMARVAEDRANIHSLRFFPRAGVYAVRTYHPRDIDNQGRMWTYVDMQDGSIVGRRHDMGESGSDAFFAWQYALHSGWAGGTAGRTVVTLLGLMTIWLCLSGLRLMLRRRAGRRANPPSPSGWSG